MKPAIRVTRKMEAAHIAKEVFDLAWLVGYSGIRYHREVKRLSEKYGHGQAADFCRFQRGARYMENKILGHFTRGMTPDSRDEVARLIRLGRKQAREIEQNLNGANLVLSLA